MTVREAMGIYASLRTAVTKIGSQPEVQARNELCRAHIISSSDSQEIASALSGLRAVFARLEEWERLRRSN